MASETTAREHLVEAAMTAIMAVMAREMCECGVMDADKVKDGVACHGPNHDLDCPFYELSEELQPVIQTVVENWDSEFPEGEEQADAE